MTAVPPTAPRATPAVGDAEAQAIVHTLFDLLDRRAAQASVCPSEVARALGPGDWRERMPAVHAVARELALQGRLEIRQRGRAVDPSSPPRGPVRLAKPPG